MSKVVKNDRKNLRWSALLSKLQGLGLRINWKKLLRSCFTVGFAKYSIIVFLQNTNEWVNACAIAIFCKSQTNVDYKLSFRDFIKPLGKIFVKKRYNCSWDFLRRNRRLRFLKNLKKHHLSFDRSSHSEVFLEKGILKICSKFTGEHPCRSVISIQLQSNFWEEL